MAVDDDLLLSTVRQALRRHGLGDWLVSTDEAWCRVGPPYRPDRLQGWKLHVSATALSAPLVLARAADVLARHRCPFKFGRTLEHVRELCSKRVDRGSGGKFLTAYPDLDDAGLRTLAEELHRATVGLPGPGIMSDRAYRPGGLVHYRFGAYGRPSTLDNDGGYRALLIGPDGRTHVDERKAWFSPPSWAPPDPFQPEPVPARRPGPVLLNDRYVVREVIRHTFVGGVFRAEDKETGANVIVKQARRYTGGAADARETRRHEADVLTKLAGTGRVPRLVEVFQQQGDLFLVEERIEGRVLRDWAEGGLPVDEVVRVGISLVELLSLVHDYGFVHRDFGPGNVMVGNDGQLFLVDVESLCSPGEPATRTYTPGYSAPEQLISPAVDLYALGATLFFLVSGANPTLAADDSPGRTNADRLDEWLALMAPSNPVVGRFADLIVALLDENPEKRPGLAEVSQWLTERRPSAPTYRRPDLDRLVDDSLAHLLSTMDGHNPSHLWPSAPNAAHSGPLNVQHGAAGVLGVLTHTYASHPTPALRTAIATAAQWICQRLYREPRLLPGLHFGSSGTAWALIDAGRRLGDEDLCRTATAYARRIPLQFPALDVCHGLAGAGLTQLRFWETTGEADFLDGARQTARAVLEATVRQDGAVNWPVPADFASGLAGQTHLGFAHGVAGIGSFLLAAARATGDESQLAAAIEAGETLRRAAVIDGPAAYWTTGEPGATVRRTHWCHGSSGIGTFLLRLWTETGDEALLDLAVRAAAAVRATRWQATPVQCHGLAGDGEFLLDLAAAGAGDRFRDWAEEIAIGIYARNTIRGGRLVVPDETGTAVRASFGAGLAGVLAFLVRLRSGGPRPWLPDLLAPNRSVLTR